MHAAILIDFMKRLVQEVRKGNSGKSVPGAGQPESASRKSRAGVAAAEQGRYRSLLPAQLQPGANPDEMLNANSKAAVTAKAPNRRKGQLKQAAIGHLRHLQKSPAKVRQFFLKESVKYAA